MDFAEKYQLLEPLPGEGVESYRARQGRDGWEVSAHLLPGGKSSPETKALMGRLIKLPPPSMAKVLEVGEYRGQSFVVIAGPPFLHFHEWLKAEETAAQTGVAAGPPANPPAPEPSSPPPGEFTRLFQTQSPAKPAAPQTASPPGEFTRLFSAPSQSPPAAPREPDSPAAQTAALGEFTRLFEAAQPPVSAAPSAAATPPLQPPATPAGEWTEPAAKSEPGEFTRLFQAPPPSGPLPEQLVRSEPAPGAQFANASSTPRLDWDQSAATPQGPGEFTRLFRSAPPPSRGLENQLKPAPPAPAAADPGGEFTRIFGHPQAPLPAPAAQPPAAPAPPVPSVAAATPAGPGEFTRMMAAPPVPGVQVPQPAPAAAAPSYYAPPIPQPPQMPAPSYAPPPVPQPPQMPAPSYAPPPIPQPPQMPAAPQPAAPTAAAPTNLLVLAIVGLIGFLAGVLVTFLMLRR